MCEDCKVYTHKEDVWVVNPKTRQWIISYYPPTKYLWWNYDFFENIYKYLSMDIGNREPIKDWVKDKLNVEIGLCEPDRLPGDYNWSRDFDSNEVVDKGNLFNE